MGKSFMCNTTSTKDGELSRCKNCGQIMSKSLDPTLQYCDQECIDAKQDRDEWLKETQEDET